MAAGEYGALWIRSERSSREAGLDGRTAVAGEGPEVADNGFLQKRQEADSGCCGLRINGELFGTAAYSHIREAASAIGSSREFSSHGPFESSRERADCVWAR